MTVVRHGVVLHAADGCGRLEALLGVEAIEWPAQLTKCYNFQALFSSSHTSINVPFGMPREGGGGVRDGGGGRPSKHIIPTKVNLISARGRNVTVGACWGTAVRERGQVVA